MKKLSLLFCILTVLALLFSSCGASGKSVLYEDASFASKTDVSEISSKDIEVPGDTVNAGEKIIYSVDLSMETKEFDKTVTSFEALIKEYKGYVQYSNVTGDTYYREDGTSTILNRMANYTVAVPCESFDSAVGSAEQLGNVTNKVRSAENVTSQYTDIEARLESLRVQEERILAMMEESKDIGTLITLEERLSEITYQKESFQRQLDNLERKVAYSTITVKIREVSTYTPTVSKTRSFGERLADAFRDGWQSFIWGLENFLVWFAEALPTLVLLALIAVGIILFVRWNNRRRKRRREQKAATAVPAQGRHE